MKEEVEKKLNSSFQMENYLKWVDFEVRNQRKQIQLISSFSLSPDFNLVFILFLFIINIIIIIINFTYFLFIYFIYYY